MIDWIKTQNMYPDTGKSILNFVIVLAYDGRHVKPLMYAKDTVRNKTVFRWKYLDGRLYFGPDITHWAYLPEPPCDEKIGE